MKIKLALILSLGAGLSTVLGGLFIFLPFKKENKDKIISLALSFSLVIMIGVSLFDLIPEALAQSHNKILILNLILPLLGVSFILLKIIYHFLKKIDNNLYKLGILSMITLMIHNFPEGIITFLSTCLNKRLGIKLSIAIAMHNIPEGIAIAVPIYYATGSKKKALQKTLMSALAEPLGAILAYIFLARFITPFMIAIILIVVAGIMITLAIEDILPESLKYQQRKYLIIGMALGTLFLLISLII